MSDQKLRERLVKAAYENPHLRAKILPVLKEELKTSSAHVEDFSWLKNADAKGKNVQEFLKEHGDEKVKNPNPDSRDKHPEVKVKSLPSSDKGKGMFQKLYDKWKSKGKDKKDSDKGDSKKQMKKLRKMFRSPSDEDKMTFWREVKHDMTPKNLVKKDDVDTFVEDHLEKAIKMYVEKPPKKPSEKPSMKELAMHYSRQLAVDQSSKRQSAIMFRVIKRVVKANPQILAQISHARSNNKTAAGDIPYGETDRLLESLRGDAVEFISYMRRLKAVAEDLEAMVKIAEGGRFDRSETIDVSGMQFDGEVITGKCKSSKGNSTYKVRISLTPNRGFNCGCPDRKIRGKSAGPCKHVLALGREFWNENLQPELEEVEKAFDDVLSKMNLLPR